MRVHLLPQIKVSGQILSTEIIFDLTKEEISRGIDGKVGDRERNRDWDRN